MYNYILIKYDEYVSVNRAGPVYIWLQARRAPLVSHPPADHIPHCMYTLQAGVVCWTVYRGLPSVPHTG